jgi:hypothetical protein
LGNEFLMDKIVLHLAEGITHNNTLNSKDILKPAKLHIVLCRRKVELLRSIVMLMGLSLMNKCEHVIYLFFIYFVLYHYPFVGDFILILVIITHPLYYILLETWSTLITLPKFYTPI